MPDHFLLEKDGRIATLTFNRPEKRNPLNEEIVLELESLLHQVRDDTDTRVLIFTGTGNTFSAGADLSQVKGITDPQERQRIFASLGKRRARLIGRTLHVLANLEQVTIAAINGYAIGGGWALALGCDLRIAVEGAEFWFPEVDLGVPLSPESTALLATHVSPSLAKEIIITCRHFKAEELLPLGQQSVELLLIGTFLRRPPPELRVAPLEAEEILRLAAALPAALAGPVRRPARVRAA